MAFTVHDFNDLKQLLAEHPDWRDELRRAILDDDFLALPQIVRELAEAQKRTEARMEELVARVEELAARMDKLAEAQLAMLGQIQHLNDRVGRLDGRMMEIEFERKATAYFGRILRRAKVVERNVLEELLEERGLDDEKINDIQLLDLVVRGKSCLPLANGERSELWLAVEISNTVDAEDVTRAERRAQKMRDANLPVVPVVAGEEVTKSAESAAHAKRVVMLIGGRLEFLEEALQRLA